MYQPVYGIVSDNVGCTRTTSSRRGKTESISFTGKTHFGDAVEVNVISKGRLYRKDEEEAERKIVKWALKYNQKKVEEWSTKLKERKDFNKEQESQERVRCIIEFFNNNKMEYSINGVLVTPKMLEVIRKNPEVIEKLEIANNLEDNKENK